MEDLRRDVLRVLPDIRRFAISLTGNTADGDDLLQTTVERVLKVDSETQLLSRITLAAVIEKIQALPEDQRAVISLVTLEGYSYRAVSELLDIPMGTVMSRLSRARRTLSDKLEDGASDNIVPLKNKKL